MDKGLEALNALFFLKKELALRKDIFMYLKLKKRNTSSMKNKTVCIHGLGYVSLPLAKAFVIEKEINPWNGKRVDEWMWRAKGKRQKANE